MPKRQTHYHDFSSRPLGSRLIGHRPETLSDSLLTRLAATPIKRPQYVMHEVGVRYNQGTEGACVGMGLAGWCSAYDYSKTKTGVLYDAFRIYEEAKTLDNIPGEDYSGTTVKAGLEVVHNLGAPRLSSSTKLFVDSFEWATGIEDILNYVANIGPVVSGLAWYTNFDNPIKHSFNGGQKETFFIGEGDLGSIRGEHCILIVGYYRNRQGKEWIRFQNSWGYDYPLVWMPINTAQILWSNKEFEAALISGNVVEK